jgi:hypothetical protein
MSLKKYTAFTFIAVLIIGALLFGCDEDTNYDQRTVVYVSNINEGYPYLSDVRNQGDSLYERDGVTIKYDDDFWLEDWVKIQFHNRPYNSVVDPNASALGDFLVTGYKVEYTTLDPAGTSPVPAFIGETSILVPANSLVEGGILLVPVYTKRQLPLVSLEYTANEIMTNAHITFYGHEIQTDREIEFTAGLLVNFADILDEDEQDKN